MTALHADLSNRKSEFVFSSESVSEGHPDKVCDQISDAVLDAYLKSDPQSRVACESMVTKDRVILCGEITSSKELDSSALIKDVIREIGYTRNDKGFDYNCTIENYLHGQSGELRSNAWEGNAGDQGLMFGYACDQTKQMMPLPIQTANLLLQELSKQRKSGAMPYLLPDAKSQVSFRYQERIPVALDTLVISTNHLKLNQADFDRMKHDIIDLVAKPVIQRIEAESIHEFEIDKCEFKMNPSGMWEEGGPAADTGLTGRKIIVDTYGGWAQHGGGAFSGKDSTKVDRSAAYMARHMAKSLVASGLAKECLIQIAYIIGEKRPVSLMVDTFNTGAAPDWKLVELLNREFDLTVKGIIEYLELTKPIFRATAAYGHFGREDQLFKWETTRQLSL
jgi:S-adenosylmethionine synthetase